MANQVAKQVDVLGFSRMEIANVRRAYGANKLNYTKLNKLYEKAANLKAEIDAVQDQIKQWDAPVRALSQEKVGVELSSEEILLAHTEPERFFLLHPELKPEEPLAEAAEAASVQAEEAEAPEAPEEAPAEGPEL